jgi:hypothetical protein
MSLRDRDLAEVEESIGVRGCLKISETDETPAPIKKPTEGAGFLLLAFGWLTITGCRFLLYGAA